MLPLFVAKWNNYTNNSCLPRAQSTCHLIRAKAMLLRQRLDPRFRIFIDDWVVSKRTRNGTRGNPDQTGQIGYRPNT